jgi:WhiB family transcriptional regulator, redox-sensing transcriptional regulator
MTAAAAPPPLLLGPSEGADWRWWAACAWPGVDPELFFPAPGQQGTRAKRICSRCPVRAVCLDEALAVPADDDHGVRGGMNAQERRRLRRELAGRAR